MRRERSTFFWQKGERKITKTFQKLDTSQTLNHIFETECHSGDQVSIGKQFLNDRKARLMPYMNISPQG